MTCKIEAFRDEFFFLSNMFPTQVTINGLTYGSSEAAFQSFKYGGRAQRVRFTNMGPYESKKYWKDKKDLIRPDWMEIRLEVMKAIVEKKFKQNRALTISLMETNGCELQEGNYWNDTYWGVCFGKGENHLGKILMDLREKLLLEGKP
jgi:ribA/ribD-fused uncharacterized protein